MYKIVVFYHQRDRRTKRFAVADTRQYLDRIGLDLHPAAASITLLTEPKLTVNGGDINRQACGNAFDDSYKRLSVRFARGCEFEMHCKILTQSRKVAETQRRKNGLLYVQATGPLCVDRTPSEYDQSYTCDDQQTADTGLRRKRFAQDNPADYYRYQRCNERDHHRFGRFDSTQKPIIKPK